MTGPIKWLLSFAVVTVLLALLAVGLLHGWADGPGAPHIEINGVPWNVGGPLSLHGLAAALAVTLVLMAAALALPLAVLLPLIVVVAVVGALLLLVVTLVAGIATVVLSPVIVVLAVGWFVWRGIRSAATPRAPSARQADAP